MIGSDTSEHLVSRILNYKFPKRWALDYSGISKELPKPNVCISNILYTSYSLFDRVVCNEKKNETNGVFDDTPCSLSKQTNRNGSLNQFMSRLTQLLQTQYEVVVVKRHFISYRNVCPITEVFAHTKTTISEYKNKNIYQLNSLVLMKLFSSKNK